MSGLWVFATLVVVFCASVATERARAQTPVDVELVLAVDSSGSVNERRFNLQKSGYVAALRDPRVLKAIQSGAAGAIAVTMFQWTGALLQREVIPWTVVRDAESGKAASAAIEAVPRRLFGGGTSISGAIDYAMTLFPRATYRDARLVIDVSGDGSNNSGRMPMSARDDAVAAGATINGLPILNVEPRLDDYYRQNVIGGDGAFVIAVKDFDGFADAIVKKLIAEIAANDDDGGRQTRDARRRF